MVYSKTLYTVMKFLWLIIILFVMSFLLWCIVVRTGEGCVKILFFTITCDGIYTGLSSALRITGMLLTGLMFIFTTRVEEMAYGLRFLGFPYRAVFASTTAIRLLPVFLGAGSIIVEAQESRGHDINTGSIIRRIKNYIPLLIPSFLYGIRNVLQFSIALEVRGFSRKNKRTIYLDYKFSIIDAVVLIIFLTMNVSSIMALLRW
jgi:energy-coupling factor transport system permease protein